MHRCTLYTIEIGELWRSNSQTDANSVWWLRKKMSQIEKMVTIRVVVIKIDFCGKLQLRRCFQ